MKTKTYKFNQDGFKKAQLDRKSEKIGFVMDIAFWSIMGLLCVEGVVGTGLMTKMVACTATSKTVRFLMAIA